MVVKNKYIVLDQLENDEGIKILWENYQRKYEYAGEYNLHDIMTDLKIYFDKID